MCVYLRAKFKVSSIVLTSFRQGWGGVIPPRTSKRIPKIPTRLGLKKCTLVIGPFLSENFVTFLRLTTILDVRVGPWK